MAQVVNSGKTGDCTWVVTGTSGNYILTIDGTGTMGDYASSNPPWCSYRTGIKALHIGNNVSGVSASAFSNYPITDVIMPTIYPEFINPSLEKLTVTSACTALDCGSLAPAVNLKELAVPFIGTSAVAPTALSALFNGSVPSSLKKLSIVHSPAEITIASGALQGLSQLNELNLSSNVIGIGKDALSGCYGLRNIHLRSTAAPVAYEGISESVYALCVLHVPVGRASHYGSRFSWKEFLNNGGIQEEAPIVTATYNVQK